MQLHHRIFGWSIALVLCVACTTPEATLPATPTAIAPDITLNETTYTVEVGDIRRVLEETVRAVPVKSTKVGFGRSGVVQNVAVQSGQAVVQGDLLAELQQTEAQQALSDAQNTLAEAQATLQSAQEINDRLVTARQAALDEARSILNELLPGGEKDVVQAAQQDYDAKLRAARITAENNQDSVDSAQQQIQISTQDLIDVQYAYSKAYWHWDWVVRYGTDPVEPYIFVNGKWERNYLDAEGKRRYERAYFDAQVSLANAEKTVSKTLRDVQRTNEEATTTNQQADKDVATARRTLDNLLTGKDTTELRLAKLAVDSAQAELEDAMRNPLKAERAAVTAAQKLVEVAQSKVDAGRIVAPADGVIAVITIQPGSSVAEFVPVVEIADPSAVEYAATLTNDSMQRLSEGQSVTLRPVERPDIEMQAIIRRLPPPYGASGGSLADTDTSTRFQIVDPQGYVPVAGQSIARMQVIIEQQSDALWLPPEAIRRFNQRTFVIRKTGNLEERVNVTLGIQSDTQVEITSGLRAGDVVIGQ